MTDLTPAEREAMECVECAKLLTDDDIPSLCEECSDRIDEIYERESIPWVGLDRREEGRRMFRSGFLARAAEAASARESSTDEIDRLKEGMAEHGFIVGRNPDGVDDTVAATLLVVSELLVAHESSREGE